MKTCLLACAILLAAMRGAYAQSQFTPPFESGGAFAPANAIDEAVLASLTQHGLAPANPCSDEVFLRRVFLDVIGTLPTPEEARAFLNDETPGKRAALIDALLARGEFADYWAMKWGDLLRIKAEFPINLWPNAVQAYHRWIRDSIRQNLPYDQFARELLTSSGSNFRVPPANFYRAVQARDPAALAGAVALTFMGERIEKWPEARRSGMAAFFSRVAYKKSDEWKEEIVGPNPETAGPLDAVFPDGTPVTVSQEKDPRRVFADWLITPENPWFARNIVNRVWSWLMGHGIIDEPDDIRPENPPSNPELLVCLQQELVKTGFDLQHIYRLILNSSVYQQSPIPQANPAEAERLFACYPVRRLDAEVLIDALNGISGAGEDYSSAIPEPFTFVPQTQRSIMLADGSITSSFLETFGRPARDTGLESERNNQPNDAQRLCLLNSTQVRKKIQQSARLRQLVRNAKGNYRQIVRSGYLTLLSRYPTDPELEAALAYFKTDGLAPKQAVEDLVWALINSKEFLYRH